MLHEPWSDVWGRPKHLLSPQVTCEWTLNSILQVLLLTELVQIWIKVYFSRDTSDIAWKKKFFQNVWATQGRLHLYIIQLSLTCTYLSNSWIFLICMSNGFYNEVSVHKVLFSHVKCKFNHIYVHSLFQCLLTVTIIDIKIVQVT